MRISCLSQAPGTQPATKASALTGTLQFTGRRSIHWTPRVMPKKLFINIRKWIAFQSKCLDLEERKESTLRFGYVGPCLYSYLCRWHFDLNLGRFCLNWTQSCKPFHSIVVCFSRVVPISSSQINLLSTEHSGLLQDEDKQETDCFIWL